MDKVVDIEPQETDDGYCNKRVVPRQEKVGTVCNRKTTRLHGSEDVKLKEVSSNSVLQMY